jgi:hypothetical protein
MVGPEYCSAWFAASIKKHSEVKDARMLPNSLVEIDRKEHAPITVAPLADLRIDESLVEAVLETTVPTTIVLVPKVGHYDWSARELAADSGSSILTFGELYASMREGDPRRFLDKNVDYSRRRLAQHSRVTALQMVCESSMRLHRGDALSNVTVAVEYEYEFSEEALVRAIQRHPDADVILNANPNGSRTTAAQSHADDTGVPVFKVGELMGALNFDGAQLRDYTPPERR